MTLPYAPTRPWSARPDTAIRRHANRVGMPADDIIDVADTLIIRPDPANEAAAS